MWIHPITVFPEGTLAIVRRSSDRKERLSMNLHRLKPRFRLLVGLLISLAAISLAQTSDIVCPGSWKQVSNSGPVPRFFYSMAFEPRGPHGHVLLFGGTDFSSLKEDTWSWDGTAWIQAADTGPSGRSLSAMAYDIARRQMLLFGGVVGDDYI